MMMKIWLSYLKRDLLIAFRLRSEMIQPVLFYILIVAMFPLGAGSDHAILEKIAAGIIWVTALLASMLSLDSLFRSDYEDGSLEQMTLSDHPLSLIISAKVFSHWLTTALPLIAVTPLLSVLLFLPENALGTLMLTLLLGTPVLSLIGAIGVALTVGLRRGGVILSLLILPLYVPVLIFSTLAIQNAAENFSASAQLSMLAAILILAITIAPFAIAAALKISLS